MEPVSHSRAEGLLLLLAALAIAVLCAIVTLTVVSRWFDWLLIPDEVLLVRELIVEGPDRCPNVESRAGGTKRVVLV
mgnify:CR=1 FL=1